ncbi:MAG: PAS domain S-box protein [Thermodesulfobacteriota bacterium]
MIKLNPAKTNTAILVGLVALFCLFVVVWEHLELADDRHDLQENAQVITSALWNLDPLGPVAYLELAAKYQNLERITVFAGTDEVFLDVKGPECGLADRVLMSIGLIPEIKLNADVVHQGTVVGRIEAIHRHATIYLYLYLLLIMGLILLVARFYVRTVEAKNILEIRVDERTQDLVVANKGLQQEIHDRIKAEEALRSSEEKYRQIYNAPSDAIFMHDATTGAILDVNRAGLEMFGYSHDELQEQGIGGLSSGEPPYDGEHGTRKLARAVAKGPQLFDWRVKNKNGDLFWAEVGLRYTEFSGKKCVIAVLRDISARKEAEEALAAEQERLAVTMRSIGDGVITTDIDGNVVLINKIAEKLTGWEHEEATGKPLAEVFHIINGKTRKRCESPLAQVLATGKVIALARHTVLVGKDGSECSIADSGAPIRDKKSEVVGVVLVFRDVTEEKKKEKELAKGRKLESVGLLAGGIAHDFNNILAAILGNINLAMLYTNPDDRSHSLLQDAEKASLRAKDLTQQLLTFAKGGEPVKELAAIKDIIQDSARFVLRGSNVRCNFHFDKDLWPVEIDLGQMSQVIQNIIINANQAMPEGGVVEVRCTNVSKDLAQSLGLRPRDYVVISVQDSGIGIDRAMLEKIFDPYFTTKQQGSGLGLAVSHSIISKHDGYIKADSRLGEGTTFTLYLPAAKGKKLVRAYNQRAVQAEAGQGRIMIMDDEEMVRKVMQGMLVSFGYEVLQAKDGEEAVALFKEARESGRPLDLIVMDLTIPGGMGGQEAVQEIHKIDSAAKVIVASGYSNDPIMANCQDYGFLAAIIKPFKVQDLQAVIRRVL